MVANPGLNPYDIRKSGSQSGDSKKEQIKSQLQKYLNFPEVQKQLGVHRTWKEDSDEVCKRGPQWFLGFELPSICSEF